MKNSNNFDMYPSGFQKAPVGFVLVPKNILSLHVCRPFSKNGTVLYLFSF